MKGRRRMPKVQTRVRRDPRPSLLRRGRLSGGRLREHQPSGWRDHDRPRGAALDRFSLARRQQRQRDLDRSRAGNRTERGAGHRMRQRDRTYASDARDPARKVADMPNAAGSLLALRN